MEQLDSADVVPFADAAAGEAWLEMHHDRQEGASSRRSGRPGRC